MQRNERVCQLNHALEQSNLSEVTRLLAEFDENSINDYDVPNLMTKRRPIDVAVESSTAEIVALLCRTLKPDLNSACESSGNFPVHTLLLRAARDKKNIDALLQIFEVLMANNANLLVKDTTLGFSLVHFAVTQHLHEFIRPLVIDCNCDINACDRNGRSPLWHAKDKFGHEAPVVRHIQHLGGREITSATQTALEQMDQRGRAIREKYSASQALTMRVLHLQTQTTQQHADTNRRAETETDDNRAVSSIVAINSATPNTSATTPSLASAFSTIHAHPIRENLLIDKMTIILLKNSTDTIFRLFLREINRSSNKAHIIASIVTNCESNQKGPQDRENYAKRLEQLNSLVANESHTLAGPKSN